MAKKLVLVRHRETDELMYTFHKRDLARILGVSSRTISRRYSDVGVYKTVDYTIYICDKKYDNGIEGNYNRDVIPPINSKKIDKSLTSPDIIDIKSDNSSNVRQITMDNIRSDKEVCLISSDKQDRLSLSSEDVGQSDDDWRIIEDSLSVAEYDDYYSKRTFEELSRSKLRYDNVRNQSTRLKFINKYGELRIND